eukprot:m.150876 g.150876  ORF g.150876 m.150876 type:complete len:107 (-) comp16325_c1_seq2:1862-2182(-)
MIWLNITLWLSQALKNKQRSTCTTSQMLQPQQVQVKFANECKLTSLWTTCYTLQLLPNYSSYGENRSHPPPKTSPLRHLWHSKFSLVYFFSLFITPEQGIGSFQQP